MSTPTASHGKEAKKDEARVPSRVDLSEIQVVTYKGMRLAQADEPIDIHAAKVKAMDLREDDILLCSYPKSGTHWLWRILDMLTLGKAEYSSRTPDLTTIDLQEIEKIDDVPAPRILTSHYPFSMLPEQVREGKTKMVHVYRNPKAVVTSLFFMTKQSMFPDVTLQKMACAMFDEKSHCRNMFHYWDSVIEFEKQNPDVSIFHVSYEEMKKDTAGCIRKLASYLEVGATEELCCQIAEAVSFQRQKSGEDKLSTKTIKQSVYYRSGEANDWKNHMTVALSERFDDVIRKRADSCPFSRRYLDDSCEEDTCDSEKN